MRGGRGERYAVAQVYNVRREVLRIKYKGYQRGSNHAPSTPLDLPSPAHRDYSAEDV